MIKRLCQLILLIILFTFKIDIYAKDTSKSSIVMDLDTGRILYEKNAYEKRLIASTTKIMTAILTIENSEINKEITIGEEILPMYGTNIYIEVGEKMKIQDLLYGLLLRSGNDASVVLAKYIGGTEENFVKMMNKKAKEIGMLNTTFENPHGLDDETKNYSTAYDMAILSKYANDNKVYKKISGTKKYSTSTKNKNYLWYNRNKLLTTFEYCTGGKNGYTPDAGKTLVSTATKADQNLTIVTLSDANIYETHKELYNIVFKSYKNYKIVDKNKFKINNEKYKKTAYIKSDFMYPLSEQEKETVKKEITLLKSKDAENKIGYIKIKLKQETIGQIDIYEKKQKKEDSSIFLKIKSYLLDILKKLRLGLQKSLKPGPLVPIPLEINKSVS